MEPIDMLQEEIGKVRERVHSLASEISVIKMKALQVHACAKEQDWGKLFELVKTHTDHVIEGDKVGGFRDRVYAVEIENKELKKYVETISKGRWVIGIISGIFGGLVGTGSKDIILMFISWLIKK